MYLFRGDWKIGDVCRLGHIRRLILPEEIDWSGDEWVVQYCRCDYCLINRHKRLERNR